MLYRALLAVVLLTTSAAAESLPDAKYSVGYRILDIAFPQKQSKQMLTVAIWYPTTSPAQEIEYGGPTKGRVAVDGRPASGRFPLLVFSHGYAGGGLAVVFFAEALAARGWIVAAPDHHDKDTAIRIRGGRPRGFDGRKMLANVVEITNSDSSNREKYYYRLDEFRLALNGVLQSPYFRDTIDEERIAVGGHSLGGFTALGMCGPLPDRLDRRIKAVLIFSSAVSGYLFTEQELQRVRIPSMLMFGEREGGRKRGGRPVEDIEAQLFGSLMPPKYLLDLKDGTHFSFNNGFSDTVVGRAFNGKPAEFAVIRRYGIAFLEKYVGGHRDLDDVLNGSDARLSDYRWVLAAEADAAFP